MKFLTYTLFIFRERSCAIFAIIITLLKDYINDKMELSWSYLTGEVLPLALVIGDIFKFSPFFFLKKSIEERAEAFALRVTDELEVLMAQSNANVQLRNFINEIRRNWRNYFNRLDNNV